MWYNEWSFGNDRTYRNTVATKSGGCLEIQTITTQPLQILVIWTSHAGWYRLSYCFRLLYTTRALMGPVVFAPTLYCKYGVYFMIKASTSFIMLPHFVTNPSSNLQNIHRLSGHIVTTVVRLHCSNKVLRVQGSTDINTPFIFSTEPSEAVSYGLLKTF